MGKLIGFNKITVTVIDADTLLAMCLENGDEAANNEFCGKRFAVRGIISELTRFELALECSEDFYTIAFTMTEKSRDELANFRIGDEVRVLGELEYVTFGAVIGTIQFVNCAICQ